MNKIKSLLRNFKARFTLRIVSFFKAPYKYLSDKVYDHIQEDMSNILENTNRYTDLEYKVDDKLNTEDFDYELCNAYTFSELQEKVDSLEANSDNDLDLDTISDESHPISQLIDDRTHQIHSMISELSDRVDEPYEPNIKYLVSELQKAVQDEADISVFAYLVESLYNKVADDG